MLDAAFAASYDHNKLIVESLTDPAETIAAADRVLGGAGLAHRLIVATGEPPALAGMRAFVDAGFEHETTVVMRHRDDADRPADPAITVEPVTWQELHTPDRRTWRAELPHASDEAVEQLTARRQARLRGADEVVFLAIRDADGDIVSHADVYLDAARGIAQIEEVMTDPEHQGRGYARALLADGRRRAVEAGCDLLFLEADADDWPRQLYARLGYVAIGHFHTFTRPAPHH